MESFKGILTKEFQIKDLGKLKYFLGMKVARNKRGISVSQIKYKGDLLKGTGILRCEPIETFMKLNYKFKWNKGGTPIDKGKYQRLVGKLINLTHTRPDLAFTISVVSQYMHAPCEEHLEAINRIFRYLKMTP